LDTAFLSPYPFCFGELSGSVRCSS